MHNPIHAALALDALPIGARIVATYIPEDDDESAGILFEHRTHGDRREWWDLTRKGVWFTAGEIVVAFDDMVIAYLPNEPVEAIRENHARMALDTLQSPEYYEAKPHKALEDLLHVIRILRAAVTTGAEGTTPDETAPAEATR